MTQPWSFLHVCDLQPGSRRSFRFNPAQNENGMTAYRQMGKIEGIDLLLVCRKRSGRRGSSSELALQLRSITVSRAGSSDGGGRPAVAA